jgi:hypothetical protein
MQLEFAFKIGGSVGQNIIVGIFASRGRILAKTSPGHHLARFAIDDPKVR